MAVKVGIIGSRTAPSLSAEALLKYLPPNCGVIMSGGAKGVDALAEELARNQNIPFKKFLPDYKKYGRLAPLKRNILLVKSCDELLAFWDLMSRGTAFAISVCIKENVPVRVIPIERAPVKPYK